MIAAYQPFSLAPLLMLLVPCAALFVYGRVDPNRGWRVLFTSVALLATLMGVGVYEFDRQPITTSST